MSKTKTSKLAKVEGAQRFAVHQPTAFYFNGRTYDLRTIDTPTMEALANDPRCINVQWADPGLRPKDQRQPMPVPAAPAKAAPAPGEKK